MTGRAQRGKQTQVPSLCRPPQQIIRHTKAGLRTHEDQKLQRLPIPTYSGSNLLLKVNSFTVAGAVPG